MPVIRNEGKMKGKEKEDREISQLPHRYYGKCDWKPNLVDGHHFRTNHICPICKKKMEKLLNKKEEGNDD